MLIPEVFGIPLNSTSEKSASLPSPSPGPEGQSHMIQHLAPSLLSTQREAPRRMPQRAAEVGRH